MGLLGTPRPRRASAIPRTRAMLQRSIRRMRSPGSNGNTSQQPTAEPKKDKAAGHDSGDKSSQMAAVSSGKCSHSTMFLPAKFFQSNGPRTPTKKGRWKDDVDGL